MQFREALVLMMLILGPSSQAMGQQDLDKLEDIYPKLRYRDTTGKSTDPKLTAGVKLLDNLRKLVAAELKPKFSCSVSFNPEFKTEVQPPQHRLTAVEVRNGERRLIQSPLPK